MKKNDVIAIIIIILFIILAAVSFGIWKLVSMAKNHMSVTGSGTSSSHSSRDIADYIDDLDTDKSASAISRYQEFPYAHFHSSKTKPDPDGMNKTSPEYQEGVRKAIKALEEKYLGVYQDYQASKNDLILLIEEHEEYSWNEFILDPSRVHALWRRGNWRASTLSLAFAIITMDF
ncbi:hypothetical protein BFJ66_g651 [Fusarium oxysporum f. sp. cepae]|uniref:Uncharacterized protein n=1 Tax=Fusarium oxysporum f. sp. cepae TaxID=396571 RepID=A0A3L6NDS7_FUSOX|nr:hypothetical protein BFJ65_g9653 [Fusarium oxysporum f. sp. cepae]RKK62865.1 hypothetical protein BFJ66_g651 [Fusarium oxysporum f. sp. cepae]